MVIYLHFTTIFLLKKVFSTKLPILSHLSCNIGAKKYWSLQINEGLQKYQKNKDYNS